MTDEMDGSRIERSYLPEVYDVLLKGPITKEEIKYKIGVGEWRTKRYIKSIPQLFGIPVEKIPLCGEGIKSGKLEYFIKQTPEAREVLEDLLDRKRFNLTEIDIQLVEMFMIDKEYTREELGRVSTEAGSHVNNKLRRIEPYLRKKGREIKWGDEATGLRTYWGQKIGENKNFKDEEEERKINKKELIKKFNRLTESGKIIYFFLLKKEKPYTSEITEATGLNRHHVLRTLSHMVDMDLAQEKREGKQGEKVFYIPSSIKMVISVELEKSKI